MNSSIKSFEHGGNIHKALAESSFELREILDFSANINPLGAPEWVRPFISSLLERLVHYPDPGSCEFIEAIAEHTGISQQHIVVANGTTELLHTILRLVHCKRAIIPSPSYIGYTRATELAGVEIVDFFLREEDNFKLDCTRLSTLIRPGDIVIIGTPNNPTGKTVDGSDIVSLMNGHPQSLFLIDEAFLDFIEGAKTIGTEAENVLTLNSMTKFYGVPGLRLGYGIFPIAFAQTIKNNLPDWTVNTLAQAVGAKALKDTAYQIKTRRICYDLRIALEQKLSDFTSIHYFTSEANFLLVKLLGNKKSTTLAEFCRKRGILIRRCDNYKGFKPCASFFRIAVRTKKENARLLDVLHSYFHSKSSKKKKTAKKRCRSIMLQGTCSDAGKSVITAALCRILYQDGIRVAPFKAQNMSLNSFVTLQNDEMGRAQVVQAQAAKLDPDCRMNPILLKPNSDTGSQVIVCGKPVGNMSVLEYNDYKTKIWPAICVNYNSLAEEFDAIILEGAGSPGEVNLKDDDIVNMKMAQYAEAAVIIVGDIDRGGVYASFVGVMEVLAEWERQLVAGFIVNKFRGQPSLLKSAHDYISMHTGRNVLGVIPFINNLGLPEEDSVSFKKGSFNTRHSGEGVEIVVVDFPHISNFTDIEPLLKEPDVTIRIIANASDIDSPQAIILPGSKNVIHDLRFLQSAGFAKEIKRCFNNGCEIVGICAGYQMLGKLIKDPNAIESDSGQCTALGYFNIHTVIELDKRLTRKSGVHQLSGKKVVGYEIHHGVSSSNASPVILFDDGTICGTTDQLGNVWGSYLHGIFDSDDFRRWFIDNLRIKNGLQPVGEILAPYDLEPAFDRLANCVRENIDMNSIYRLLEI